MIAIHCALAVVTPYHCLSTSSCMLSVSAGGVAPQYREDRNRGTEYHLEKGVTASSIQAWHMKVSNSPPNLVLGLDVWVSYLPPDTRHVLKSYINVRGEPALCLKQVGSYASTRQLVKSQQCCWVNSLSLGTHSDGRTIARWTMSLREVVTPLSVWPMCLR